MSSIGGGTVPSPLELALTLLSVAADPAAHKERLIELQKHQASVEEATDTHNATLALIEQKSADVDAARAQLSDERAAFLLEQAQHVDGMKGREDALANSHAELDRKKEAAASLTAHAEELTRAASEREDALKAREDAVTKREAEIGALEQAAADTKQQYETRLAALAAIVAPAPPAS